MTDTDMLYMASLEKKNNDLEAKVAELEGKHWNECRQIAHYDDELRTLLSKVDIGAAQPKDYLDLLNEWAKLKQLLMIAVEDFRQIGTNAEYDDERGYGCVLTDEHGCGEGVCPLDSGDECKWRHEAEALALIGEDTNVPASADDTNVGHKSGGWISVKDKLPEEGARNDDCIERKKAIELIQPHVKPQTIYGEGYLQAIEHATDILELMPAADVQPVNHGQWIVLDDVEQFIAKCSVCGRIEDSRLIDKMPYCHCGAKMDGDTE